MIPLALVHRIAKEKGVPETSIIRDYAQNHLLAALFQDQPIFEMAWNNSLRHQMKAVPDFGHVFDKVLQGLYDHLQREG